MRCLNNAIAVAIRVSATHVLLEGGALVSQSLNADLMERLCSSMGVMTTHVIIFELVCMDGIGR